MRGKIITIGSMKGGVGKTVTAFNLAFALMEQGKKVLAVDFDSQHNLTSCYGIGDDEFPKCRIGELMSAAIENNDLPDRKEYIIQKDGVDVIASSMSLSVVDARLRLEMGSEGILASVLDPLREDYDYILVDIGPALGCLSVNALTAADEVLIPVDPQLLAMMGLQDFLHTISKVKKRLNPKLKVTGILLTMCEARRNLYKTIIEQVESTFRDHHIRVFETRIPNTIKVGESVYYAQPLALYCPDTKVAAAYRNLGKELIAYEG